MGGGGSKPKKGAKYPIFNKRYEIDEQQRLGTGSFGRVFVGHDSKTGDTVAIKVELKKGGRLKEEARVYQDLNGLPGIPQLLWQGNTSGFSALVLTLLGPSLDDLRLLCKSFHHDIDRQHKKSRDNSPITSPEIAPASPQAAAEPEPMFLGPTASTGANAKSSSSSASPVPPALEDATTDNNRLDLDQQDLLGVSGGSTSHPKQERPSSSDVIEPLPAAPAKRSYPQGRSLIRSSTTPAIEVQIPPSGDSSAIDTPFGDSTSGVSPAKAQRRRRSQGSSSHYHSAPGSSVQAKSSSGAQLTLSTVCVIAAQAIDILEGIHSRGYVHRDLKPANFVMKRNKETDMNNELYLLDFGLAKKYIDPKTNRHVAEPKNGRTKRATGTPLFASRNAHLDVTQSRRDDLESLAYVLIFLLRDTLPWKPGPLIAKDMLEPYIKHTKLGTSLDKFRVLSQLPQCLSDFLANVTALGHSDTPQYDVLKKMFIDQIEQESGTRDYMTIRCDWTLLGHQKRQTRSKQRRHLSVNTEHHVTSASSEPAISPHTVTSDDETLSVLSGDLPSPTSPSHVAPAPGSPRGMPSSPLAGGARTSSSLPSSPKAGADRAHGNT